jgi:nucleotide-binding universal stress UspA family protein
MTTVLAALDATAAARPVLEAALGLAALVEGTVEAVHVGTGPTETPETLAARNGLPIRLLDGPVEDALLDAFAEPSVIAAVMGARGTPGGRRPVGRTAMQVLRGTSKPIVVVPPDEVGVSPRRFRRLLLPLEGTEESSRPITHLRRLIKKPVDIVVLHVFTPATTPVALDRPHRDLSLWGEEFLARHCPGATRIESRSGSVARLAEELGNESATDMIVLSWSQDPSGGHGAIVRELLARSTVPVLLLPVERQQTARDGTRTDRAAPGTMWPGQTGT